MARSGQPRLIRVDQIAILLLCVYRTLALCSRQRTLTAMNTASTLRAVYRPALRQQSPICDFLLPSFTHSQSRKQYASVTTSSASPKTEPAPETLNSRSTAKRRGPLSKEQQRFLDSAVYLFISARPRLKSLTCFPSSASTKQANSPQP